MTKTNVTPLKESMDIVPLGDNQRHCLEQARAWVVDAMSFLGKAYLEYEEARLQFEAAEKKLRSLSLKAVQQENQLNKVLEELAKVLNLGDGDWVYDGKGAMVRRD